MHIGLAWHKTCMSFTWDHYIFQREAKKQQNKTKRLANRSSSQMPTKNKNRLDSHYSKNYYPKPFRECVLACSLVCTKNGNMFTAFTFCTRVFCVQNICNEREWQWHTASAKISVKITLKRHIQELVNTTTTTKKCCNFAVNALSSLSNSNNSAFFWCVAVACFFPSVHWVERILCAFAAR